MVDLIAGADGNGVPLSALSAVPCLRVAIESLARGELEAALHAASEACRVAGNLPHPHYVYGQIWLALGAPDFAERAFAESIRISPRWADAWINFGMARYQRGAIGEAKVAMRMVLSFAPGHVVALSNLAAFMRVTGESDSAEARLRDSLVREPEAIGIRLNLAAELLSEENGSDALRLLSEIQPPRDRVALCHWLLQKSLAELQLRRVGAARATLVEIAALEPMPPESACLYHWRRTLLAVLEGEWERARAAALAMEDALAERSAVALPEHRVMAHFNLAKFWSGRGDAGRAFANWKTAHRLLARTQPFSRHGHLNYIDRTIAAFGHESRVCSQRAQNADPTPIFIVGMPRSGTTLCEQILASHRDVHGAGERDAIRDVIDRLDCADKDAGPKRLAELSSEALDAVGDRYLAELKALAPEKSRIVDKMPGNFLYLGFISSILPGARVIHCVRDPRDVGLSIFTFRFYGSHPYAHDLSDLGWYIGQHDRLMAHWKRTLPSPLLTVRLSDWIEDFDSTLMRVLEHVGLPWDASCARFHERTAKVQTVSRVQVRQPINSRGIGRWQAYASELEPLISELKRAGSLDDIAA